METIRESTLDQTALMPLRDRAELPSRLGIVFALASVYLVWGSTYLAQRVALEGFPPFLMAGIRFVTAGSILFVILRLKGESIPTRTEWGGAALVGLLLLGIGNGCVVFAEQTVASGLTALGVATVPLWSALIAGFLGTWPTKREWVGLSIGFVGLILLNADSSMRGSPAGAIALFLSAISWAFGSVWSRRLRLPSGMMSSAAQMLSGGVILLLASLAHHEHMHAVPTLKVSLTLVYLIVAAIVGFSAYTYLLKHVRPALATSYAYVNPVIAVGLGALLLHEPITIASLGALVLILTGVCLVIFSRQK